MGAGGQLLAVEAGQHLDRRVVDVRHEAWLRVEALVIALVETLEEAWREAGEVRRVSHGLSLWERQCGVRVGPSLAGRDGLGLDLRGLRLGLGIGGR